MPRVPSIQWQVTLRQLPLLAVLFVAVLFWLGYYLTDMLTKANLEVARRSNAAVVNTILASMLARKDRYVWDRLSEKIPRYEDTEIKVVSTAGRVLYSSDNSQIGTFHEFTDKTCSLCHKGTGVPPSIDSTIFRDPESNDYQLFAAPLQNSESCKACHVSAGKKLGMVLIRQPLPEIYAKVRTVQFALVIVGAIALLCTLVITRILLHRYLGRPLKRLVTGADAIGSGDLDHKIELPVQSELTVLANTLNTSAGQLNEAIGKLKKQRDDYEALYRVVDQLSRGILPDERRRKSVELACSILKRDCVLVHSGSADGKTGGASLTWRRENEEIVEADLEAALKDSTLPAFCSRETIEAWKQGTHDDAEVISGEAAAAYPLKRHGRRLGLLFVAAGGDEEDGEGVEGGMSKALSERLAIALEFSELQQEFIGQEKLAAIGETVAGLAHCLKNMINGLRAGEYVVDRAIKKDDPKKLNRGWGVMKNSVRQVEQLTLDMLYYVKGRVPERKPFDPNGVLTDVIEVLAEFAEQKGVRFEADLDEAIGKEALDRTLIYRAVLNLATNAIDACLDSEEGDLVILRSRSTAEELVLSVQDNGTGMTEEIRSRLFMRFFSTKASGGTGLGLSVVKKIAEEHNGYVRVESEPGKGSTFHIHLPRAKKT